MRLLTRTTRSVSPTDAGERLFATVAPRFDEIEAELEALSEFREKPAGTIRITTSGGKWGNKWRINGVRLEWHLLKAIYAFTLCSDKGSSKK